jgi:hypothetical protein
MAEVTEAERHQVVFPEPLGRPYTAYEIDVLRRIHAGHVGVVSSCVTCSLLATVAVSRDPAEMHGFTCGWCQWGRGKAESLVAYSRHVYQSGHVGKAPKDRS